METFYSKTKKYQKQVSKLKRRVFKHLWLVRITLIFVTVSFLLMLYLIVAFIFRYFQIDTYSTFATSFILSPLEEIQNTGGKTNILILGKGGEGHVAPDLTDTIMIASLDHKKDKIVLISLPRDIWIPELADKLNSAYYWGNQKQPGGGVLLAASLVEQISGLPIHYSVVVDFAGFVDLIDVVGGVDVEILASFVDEKYPIKGKENAGCELMQNGSIDPEYPCRYETVRFEKGVEHMSGERALVFVRSRQAEGDEGTDFARSGRQRQVVKALQKELISPSLLLRPKKISKVVETINSSVSQDLNLSEKAVIFRTMFDSRNSVSSFTFPEELLENPPLTPEYGNLYVFKPKSGDWNDIHQWIKCVIENQKENCLQK